MDTKLYNYIPQEYWIFSHPKPEVKMLVYKGIFTTPSILQNVQSTLATLVAKTCKARLVVNIIVYVNIKIGKLIF